MRGATLYAVGRAVRMEDRRLGHGRSLRSTLAAGTASATCRPPLIDSILGTRPHGLPVAAAPDFGNAGAQGPARAA